MRCDTCKFAFKVTNAAAIGTVTYECRHSPPQLVAVTMKTMAGTGLVPAAAYPQVAPDAWCGQYVEKVGLVS